jgi:hypothetical protein
MTFPLLLQSHLNGVVRLTQERWEHILRHHADMNSKLDLIKQVLEEPDEIRSSRYNSEGRLYYRFYREIFNGKYIVVVINIREGLVRTAYVTDRIKQGGLIWRKS